MKTLIIGATGYVGQGIARVLRDEGHDIAGLARSESNRELLRKHGFNPVDGDLEDLGKLADIARKFEALIFAPMIPDDAVPDIIEVLIEAYSNSGRTLIFTSGTGIVAIPATNGEWSQHTFAEDDAFMPPPWLKARAETERLIEHAAHERGVRAMSIRPPLVWGRGGSKQIPAIFQSVRVTGHACYFGMGLNLYSNVHIDDLGEVFRLVLERGVPGKVYHAVAGEANFRTLAEAVAEVTGTKARSVDYEEACSIWGEMIVKYGLAVNSRTRAVRTCEELGWVPKHLDVVDDILHGSYRRAWEAGELPEFAAH